jgi:hypothetical protein
VLRVLVLSLVLLTAFCVRLYGIGQPPMEFNAIRQYHGALLARGLYEWLLTGNLRTLPPDGIIEPPILEFVASLSYLFLGGEHLWVPRLLSALFWVVGGALLYLAATKLVFRGAALLSTVFYLFLPYSVLASRSFMPDSLMVMLLAMSVLAILLYHEKPSTQTLLFAAAASSLAVFVKPGICLFQVFGAFASLAVYRHGVRKSLWSWHLVAFAVLSVLPTALYYVYGTFVAGFLQGQVQTKVVPSYISDPYYWRGWLHSIEAVVGYVAFAGGLLGVLLTRSGPARALLAGLWGGYFVFGLVFAYHIQTHDYYSLQLVPVVALSLGVLWDSVAGYLGQDDTRNLRRAVVLGLCLLAVVVGVFEHRQTIVGIVQQGQGEGFPGKHVGNTLVADYEARAKTYREIGEVVHRSHRTVFFAPEAGYALVYHGRLDGQSWPPSNLVQWWRSDERAQRFMLDMLAMDEWPRSSRDDFGRRDYFAALQASERPPEYFIVVKRFTNRKVMNWREDRLLIELTEDFRVVAKDDDYVVFDLTKKKRGSS